MSDAKAMRQVKDIVESDPSRKFIIVSAPGKRFKEDIKITDMLYSCYRDVVEEGTCKKSFAIIFFNAMHMYDKFRLAYDCFWQNAVFNYDQD